MRLKWGIERRQSADDIHKGLYTVSLIEGDGIGPEIAQSVKDIFAAANVCSIISESGNGSLLMIV